MITTYPSSMKCNSCLSDDGTVNEFVCVINNSVEKKFYLCKACRLKLKEEIEVLDSIEKWVRGFDAEEINRKDRITDEQRREAIISQLSRKDTMVLSLALIYAENYYKYGVDITKQWTSAVQQSDALHNAYLRGCEEEHETQRRHCENCIYRPKT